MKFQAFVIALLAGLLLALAGCDAALVAPQPETAGELSHVLVQQPGSGAGMLLVAPDHSAHLCPDRESARLTGEVRTAGRLGQWVFQLSHDGGELDGPSSYVFAAQTQIYDWPGEYGSRFEKPRT